MRFGLHVSIQGSIAEAPRRAADLGCDCFQVFAGPPRNVRRRLPRRAEAEHFRALVRANGLQPVAVHAGYLLHLASPKRRVARASLGLYLRELEIATRLGARFYVMHPGSAGDRPRDEVLEMLIDGLLKAPPEAPTVLLENVAAARTGIGARFEELGRILRGLGRRKRFGVCLDTAHAAAAGYDMRTPEGVQSTLRVLFKTVGRSRVKLVHANDLRPPAGSGRDIHEHIGRGRLGRRGFRGLLSDGTMRRVPCILETPLDRDGDDRRNLAAIRRIAREAEKTREAG